ncbi:MAG: hypothetical protein J0H12_06425 [Candidatus Paracaedimonas acanthamoebae]|mgnify:CR=1 FL=1|uniref:Uncharacterized protein n=1 Tax=Candidatus Paracaedimonas acanthamoebae TaxID=244581 RepID=A0A8J7Q1S0_9PROT|nr:hypothetical protein [Candidatus Paracaedimonas acanthamoebae]
MKKNYKAFLMAGTIFLTLSFSSYSSPISEFGAELKKRQSVKSVSCPLQKGLLNYKAGMRRLSEKNSDKEGKNIGKESASDEEYALPQSHFMALKHFQTAAKNFESQFFENEEINSVKFQEIYAGELRDTLFYYGATLKQLEGLYFKQKFSKEVRITCLDKLFYLVKELIQHPDSSSLEEDTNIFTELGYGDQSAASKFSVSLDQMFLEEPKLMLFSIDLQRERLKSGVTDLSKPIDEDLFREVLEVWEPKFKKSISKKFDEIEDVK